MSESRYPLMVCSSAVALLERIQNAARSTAELLGQFPTFVDAARDPATVDAVDQASREMASAGGELETWMRDSLARLAKMVQSGAN